MNIANKSIVARTIGCLLLAALLSIDGNSQSLPYSPSGRDVAGKVRPAIAAVAEQPGSPDIQKILDRQKHDLSIVNVFLVTNTNDTGSGSFRKAILDANANAGLDQISFNIGGGGVRTITPLSPLPNIVSPVIIDGSTQPGYTGSPLIEINGSLAGVSVNGLQIYAGSSTVRGLIINRFIGTGPPNYFNGMGIYFDFNGGNKVEGCYIGTNAAGTVDLGNGGVAIGIFGGSGSNIIGGTTPLARNVLSGNLLHGVQISQPTTGRNVIQGNYLGLNAAGTGAIANDQAGIAIFGSTFPDTIGGAAPGARNILSGNGLEGIYIAPPVSGIVVQGNYFGTDVTGNVRVANVYEGIQLEGPRNIIGGTTIAERNIFSGNGNSGIYIYTSTATGNKIQGNYFGTSPGGTDTLGNNYGIVIDHASNDTIGSTVAGSGNLISGNKVAGIYIYFPTSTGNVVQGNFIGTDITGNLDRGNLQYGVVLDSAANNRIGGTLSFTGNRISGNDSSGIYMIGSTATNNKVVGNYIGTDHDATSALGNRKGIIIDNAPNNTVGGTSATERNIISGNTSSGIEIRNAGATANKVLGNYIGTDLAGTADLGNGSYGVSISSSQDTIGGPTASAGNIIAYNHRAGVFDSSGTGNLIRMNSIFSNYSGLGIDLAPRGLARNDSLDGDAGPNNLQNFPLLDSTRIIGGNIGIHGRLNSIPGSKFFIDFYSNAKYDSSHFGEAETYMGSTTVTTDVAGNALINAAFPAIPLNRYITALSVDSATGNTSELSQALCLSDSDADGIMDSWETQGWGIDVNSDSLIDLDLYALGARIRHKDLFVEVDAMTGMAPASGTLQRVIDTFAVAPAVLVNNPDGTAGVKLHITRDELNVSRQSWQGGTEWVFFQAVKDTFFGTLAERGSPNKQYILQAKRLVYRYCVFADQYAPNLSSGEAENGFLQGCNDFMVTLGGWSVDGGTPNQKAGTFMHEFGHTLGLQHGGGDGLNFKPNYISIMNYTWQMPFQWANTWRLGYSRAVLPLPTLNEAALNEQNGLGVHFAGEYPIISVPFRDSTLHIHWATLKHATSTDWTGNRDSTSAAVNVDINDLDSSGSPGEVLNGFVDWSALIYNFRHSPDFANGPTSTPKVLLEPEMTPQIFDLLDNLPPPRPAGQFLMDGLLDTSAVLLTSNGGINLYGRIKGSQLYVATNSAQSQGADMFIFLAVVPGSLQSAPWLKTGQVAAWSAFLGNESTSNSASWYDDLASPLTNITVATAGSPIVEGVIDLELLTGGSPGTVYLAAGKYQTNDGGVLLAQAPVGNGNGNIDPNEFYQFDTALPIQLASFTATPLTGGHVRLDWTTLGETNNYGFEIQRKRNGETEFQTLPNSFVPGHGTTIEPHSYSFTDTTVAAGQWWYRLKQIDLDGTIHYGPEAAVDVLTGVEDNLLPKVFALYQNYPNPFNPSTSLRYDVASATHVSLKVYNVLGQEVATLVNETKSAGRYRIEWNAVHIASGVYFYRMTAGTFSATKRLMIVK